MIKLSIGNNMSRKSTIINESKTIREAFEENGLEFSGASINLDGSVLAPGDINKSFKELGYDGTPGRDKAMMRAIVKADNA